jgi:prephenate dehydratase
VLSVAHVPGSLAAILAEFAKRSLNLTRIESRPLPGSAWEYVFFLDFEANPAEERFAEALAAVQKKCLFVKVLGSYPVKRFS